MDEQTKKDVYWAIDRAYEQLENLKAGTEEYQRQVQCIQFLETIVDERSKSAYVEMMDNYNKKKDRKNFILQVISFVGVPLAVVLLQYKVDLKLLHVEEFGSVTSRSFDRNFIRNLFMLGRAKM